MKTFTNPLNNIHIASPCAADWNEMVGDERRRFCSQCSLNVYNLSGMTGDEAENLLLTSEGRVCVRFYRRKDGTILTKDCPVGWQAVKRRLSKMATAVVSLCAGVFTGIFAFNQPKTEPVNVDVQSVLQQNRVPPSFTQATKNYEAVEFEDGWMGKPVIMGEPTLMPTAGFPENLDEVRKDIKKKRKR
ncbi:MAG TPA: hypothetical protein VF721_19185 [Pyrinomonadaceae bacterium]|jgi:hypothetical protein